MPITPREAMESPWLPTHQAEYDHHTKRIDEVLRSDGRRYSLHLMAEKVVRRVIEVYTDLGWVVMLHRDNRDGDYLEFYVPTPPPPPPPPTSVPS